MNPRWESRIGIGYECGFGIHYRPGLGKRGCVEISSRIVSNLTSPWDVSCGVEIIVV